MLCQDDEQIGQGQVSRWSGYTKATSTVIPNCKEQLPTLVFVGYATVGGTADRYVWYIFYVIPCCVILFYYVMLRIWYFSVVQEFGQLGSRFLFPQHLSVGLSNDIDDIILIFCQ
jgi:hypothetical protein